MLIKYKYHGGMFLTKVQVLKTGLIITAVFTVIIYVGLKFKVTYKPVTTEEVEHQIGVRDARLTNERIEQAILEWESSYDQRSGYSGFAIRELPEGPQTVIELFTEFAKMYRGESPFTFGRSIALQYYSEQEPIASELAPFGMIPIPDIYLESDRQSQIQEVQDSYEKFNLYVDQYIIKKYESD